MDFDRIVRTDIEASERGFTATMRFDEAAVRAMVDEVDAELFDRIAAARGYRRRDVDVAALREIAEKLEYVADYGSWQAETAGRIRAAIEGEAARRQTHGSRAERPEPDVLAADGLPIKVGETVYGAGREQGVYTVVSMRAGEGRFSVECMDRDGELCMVDASMTAHLPFDTQERIDEDAMLTVSDYWDCRDCEHGACQAKIDGEHPNERYETDSCLDAMILDLLRRQRELDARTMGRAS